MNTDNFAEQMHLMGKIEALLTVEVLLQAKRQVFEEKLAELKKPTTPKPKEEE